MCGRLLRSVASLVVSTDLMAMWTGGLEITGRTPDGRLIKTLSSLVAVYELAWIRC